MEIYDVTVWDISGGINPEGWLMESPPVRVEAMDSHLAALRVARRANPRVKLVGIQRPEGSPDVFFKDPEMEMVFQITDTFIRKPRERR